MPVQIHIVIRKDSYYDSVLLMRISREVKALNGVEDAVVAMATPHNKELLAKTGFASAALSAATANDLVIAVKAAGMEQSDIDNAVEVLMKARVDDKTEAELPQSLNAAVKLHPEANLVLISLPGEHAAREARRALAQGKHVMLFSDNVSVEEEISLKKDAVQRGLLMMGPDCGTAIINGKPLAFANVVRRGPIGIVGAAGTGIQEVSSCLDRLGAGISQAIGTGGRDLSDAVGGAMVLLGIEALAADPATRVLVVISKPPSPAVAEKVIAAVIETNKPAVVHFVGATAQKTAKGSKVIFADSLAGTAEAAAKLAGVKVPKAKPGAGAALARKLKKTLGAKAQLRGLFCGGTTGHEALAILSRAGLSVFSNLHKKGELRIDGTTAAQGHVLLDLGDDVFTQGRPHPMIDPELRNERLEVELNDKRVGLLLFDVVLGFGSHPDPAGVLAAAVTKAKKKRKNLVAIASITGTAGDPQNFTAQLRALEQAGIVVMPDNRQAAELAAQMLQGGRR